MEGANQLFKYEMKSKQIENTKNNVCLEGNLTSRDVRFAKCDGNEGNQKWSWSSFTNKTMLENWEESGRPFEGSDSYYWAD